MLCLLCVKYVWEIYFFFEYTGFETVCQQKLEMFTNCSKKGVEFVTVGEKIKEFREKRGLTQAELGEKTGYSQASITNLEKNYKDLPAKRLKSMANALGCSPLDLLPED